MSLTRLQNARRVSSSSLLNAMGRGYIYDADAEAYIAAVEQADGAPLEYSWRQAIAAFVAGCKTDSIWSAMAVCYIMCGARTLAGALKPLKGSAPTNNGPFVSGDYTRGGISCGLKGNGSTKYLDTGRADNVDGQDDCHRACWVTVVPTAQYMQYFGARNAGSTTMTEMYNYNAGGISDFARCRSSSGGSTGSGPVAPSFRGISRSGAASFVSRTIARTTTKTETSVAPTTNKINVFANGGTTTDRSDATIAFFSAGSSLTLTTLETRVTSLILAAQDLA